MTPLPLGRATARGAFWVLAQALGSKGVTLLAQYLVAMRLSRDDFGLFALALTVATVAGAVQQLGVKQVLIQRGDAFDRWANAGFWMALSAGMVAAVAIIAAAPVAVAVFHDRRLMGPIWVLALGAPLESLWTVPMARLSRELRFGALASCTLFNTVATAALTVTFAWLGFGVYSFVVPRLLAALAQAAILWRISGVPLQPALEVAKWRLMLRDASMLVGVALATALLLQGDYLLLGMTASAAVVGSYYFAYTLSSQTMQLVSVSLGSTLFPALSTLQSDPARQVRSCIAACRALVLVGTPVCLAQAALGGPLIRLFFGAKWLEAIPVFEVLSVGMAMLVPSPVATSLMQAQRRFTRYLGWTVICALGFLGSVGVGIAHGGAFSVGAAVAAFYAVFGPAGLYVAIRPAGGTWRDVWHVYALPLALSAAIALAWVAVRGGLHLPFRGELPTVVLLLCAGAALYAAGALRWARSDVRNLANHVLPLARRLVPDARWAR